MIVNQQYDYRNPPQATPSPQPLQVHPFSVSPQPNQMGVGLFQQFGATTSAYNGPQFTGSMATNSFQDFNFMVPMNSTTTHPPIPVVSAPLDSITQNNMQINMTNFQQQELNIDNINYPSDHFIYNSAEVRNILQTNDFSTGLSTEQSRDPRDGDDRGLSDSLSKLL